MPNGKSYVAFKDNFVLKSERHKWTQFPAPASYPSKWGGPLYSVWLSPSGKAYFLGSQIYPFNGKTWDPPIRPVGSAVDIVGFGSESFYFSCLSGEIGKLEGQQRVRMALNSINSDLNGIWANDKNNIFAVGDDGTILHCDGRFWSEQDSGTDTWLHDVWGTSPDNVYATGYRITLHYDGKTWSRVDIPTYNFKCIWGSSQSDIYIGGWDGVLLHYDGEKWSQVDYGIKIRIHDIWGSAPNNVYLLGDQGAIVHYSEETKCSAPARDKQPGLATVTTTSSIEHDWDKDVLKEKYKVAGNVETMTNVREFTATTDMAMQNAVFTYRATQLDGTVGEMQFLKLKEDGTNLPYKYDTLGGLNSAEGSWWIQDTNGVVLSTSETLSLSKAYDIYFMIKDNGDYDLNPTAGTIHDPVALVKSSAADEVINLQPSSQVSTSSRSSGGCVIGSTDEPDSSLPLLLLLAVIGMGWRRMKPLKIY